MKKRNSILVTVSIVVVIAIYFTLKFRIPDLDKQEVKITDLQGQELSLENFQGKPTVVNFWATWCGACRGELPDFQKVKDMYEGRVNFVMISDETIDKIKEYVTKQSYNFTFVRSTKEFSDYGINFRPCTYIYSKKGDLVAKYPGSMSAEELQEAVSKVL